MDDAVRSPRLQPDQEELELTALLLAVTSAAHAADDAGPAEQVAVDRVCALTGWQSGRVLWPDESGSWRPASAADRPVGAPRSLQAQVRGLAATDGTPLAVQLVAGGEPAVWTSSLRVGSGPRTPLALVVAVPVVIGDEQVGVLEFLSSGGAQPSPALLAALRQVGVQLGRVVAREQELTARVDAEARARSVVELAADAYVEVDAGGRIGSWNAAAERMFGWHALEVIGKPLGEVLVPRRLRPAHERGMARALATGGSRLDGQRVQLPALHRDGSERRVEVSLSVRSVGDGWRVQAFLRDVEEQLAAAEQVAEGRDVLDGVLDGLVDGVVACDERGRLTTVNRALRELFEVAEEPRPPAEWLGDLVLYEADGCTPLPVERSPLYRALQGEQLRDEELVIGRPGALRRMRCSARPLHDADGRGRGAVCTLHDITEQTAARASLAAWERTDSLTGLPNGRVLLERLARPAGRSRRTLVQLLVEDLGPTIALHGMDAARTVVAELAARLQQSVRDQDLVAHLSADRFAVLLQHGPRTDPHRWVERILAAATAPTAALGLRPSISAGMCAVVGTRVDDAVRGSEVALQVARTRASGIEEYDPQMAERLTERAALQADLERALGREELTLRYQPQVELATGRVVGVEALVRWEHPERGNIRPDEFIPLAEETGLIVPLGRWVLEQACAQAARWQGAGLPGVRMAVNVSGRQLDEGFVSAVADVVQRTGLAAGQLELEITETVALREDAHAADVLGRLRRTGVRLSLDDFGTGYSMLGRLRELPFSQLKIDRSFVAEITAHSGSAVTVAALDLAGDLGLEVVAEGIETAEQLAFLRRHGCALGQGYLFARPVDAETVTALLAEPMALPGASVDQAAPAPVGGDLGDLNGLLAEVERLTGMESVYLTRVADGEQTMLAARNSGDLEVPADGSWSWDDSLCASALRDGPAAYDDVDARFAGNAHVARLGLVSYLGVPVPGPDGTPVGTLCAASTARVEVSSETLEVVALYARLAAEQLRRRDDAQGDRARAARLQADLTRRAAFLAQAELSVRQPLTALQGWAAALDRGTALPPQARQAAADGLAAGARGVTRHLDRLLDEARSAVLREGLRVQPLPLAERAADLVAARTSSGAGTLRIAGGPAVRVLADPAVLDKILSDVLDNAATYSLSGAVTTISWRVVASGLELSVADEGIGLEAGMDPFEPFSRGSDPAVRRLPGAGLSLYTCRALAEAMGGTLVGRANRDAGSTFALWLPLADRAGDDDDPAGDEPDAGLPTPQA